jgi:hypothetical protein
MNWKTFGSFAGKFMIAHTVTYLVVGAAAYQFLTKPFYEGPEAIFAVFMRSPAEPESWKHVMTWFIPAQLLRGLLIAAVFIPFYDLLCSWSWRKRWLTIASFYMVIGCWACAVAAPGTIEGLVYNKPVFTPYVHLKVQPELLFQGGLMAAWVARWMKRR